MMHLYLIEALYEEVQALGRTGRLPERKIGTVISQQRLNAL
jgi:hypothetical protein